MWGVKSYVMWFVLDSAIQTVSCLCIGFRRPQGRRDDAYEQRFFRSLWVLRNCGPGLVWDQDLCLCIRPRRQLRTDRPLQCPDRPPILTTSAQGFPIPTHLSTSTGTSSGRGQLSPTRGSGLTGNGGLPVSPPSTGTETRAPGVRGVHCWWYRPHPSSRVLFQQKTPGAGWTSRRCALGTVWRQRVCTCVFPAAQGGPSETIDLEKAFCENVLLLLFEGNLFDSSPVGSSVLGSGPLQFFDGGGALFDGHSHIRIPFFNDNLLGADFRVQFRFLPVFDAIPRPGDATTILSNGCGGLLPSLHVIYEGASSLVLVRVESVTKSGIPSSCSVPADGDGWRDVALVFCPGAFTVTVNGRLCSKTDLDGPVGVRACDLSLGEDLSRHPLTHPSTLYSGILDDVRVYRGCDCTSGEHIIRS